MEVQIDTIIARLYDASLQGNVRSLNNLLQQDPFILDRCLIQNSSELGGIYMQSPLHVAAHMGHLEMVKRLEDLSPSMCLANDQEGRKPIHIAAIKGHVNVVEFFHQENPLGSREKTYNGGESILHLCIKHKQILALKPLLKLTNDAELLNFKDNNGNTVLHLAVASKQYEMVKALLEDPRIDKNAENKNGLTAMDSHILLVKPKKKINKNIVSRFYNEILDWDKGDAIGPLLESSKILRAKDAAKLKLQNKNTYVESQGNALMVVASLIAIMAFQVALTPPGGLWQDNDDKWHFYRALAISNGPPYHSWQGFWPWQMLLLTNTIALASSFSVILLLISGFSFGRHFVALLRITMWTAITATTVTFAISQVVISAGGSDSYVVVQDTFLVWISLVAVLVLAHAIRFLIKSIIRRPTLRSKFIRCCTLV